jgi:hypothetical protein
MVQGLLARSRQMMLAPKYRAALIWDPIATISPMAGAKLRNDRVIAHSFFSQSKAQA